MQLQTSIHVAYVLGVLCCGNELILFAYLLLVLFALSK